MIVVADSGPIIHLSMVGQLQLLPRLYGEICIPRIVYREVVEDGAGLPGSAELRAAAWVRVHDSHENELIERLLSAELDPGEAAALTLAVALDAGWLLVDDLQARHMAKKLQLQHIGTLGILLAARKRGLIARVATDFGDATGFGKMGGEYFSLGAGTDIAPLLKGLKDDACDAPHWGYMLSGELVVTYTDGKVETCTENDLFYWPPGHSVRAVKDSEVILFSPQREHAHALDHMLNAMKG